MTAQAPEILIHRGRRLTLCERPLDDYLRRLPRKTRPVFTAPSTALWRGYVGTWEFRNDMLCLTDLEAWSKRDQDCAAERLEDVFPKSKGCIPAKWMSGYLRCPEGRLIEYVHHGFLSRYERDRMFEVRGGVLIQEWLVLNPPEPVFYRVDKSGKRTCVSSIEGRTIEEQPDPLAGLDPERAHAIWAERTKVDPDEEGHAPLACLMFGALRE